MVAPDASAVRELGFGPMQQQGSVGVNYLLTIPFGTVEAMNTGAPESNQLIDSNKKHNLSIN